MACIAAQLLPLMADSPKTRRDINVVLREHDDQLLKTPGVAGVSVGLMDDEETLCLRVMVEKRTPEIERAIPKTIEGYPVVLDVTGKIEPLGS
jgi:hypothetical protein